MKANVVALSQLSANYPETPPFDPPNPVYDAVVDVLKNIAASWGNKCNATENPLRGIVQPGARVVIKPNFVANRDRQIVLDPEHLLASSTHPAVLRPVLDLVADALGDSGCISIVDSPLEVSDIDETLTKLHIHSMLEALRQRYAVPIEFIDLRDFTFKRQMLCDDIHLFGASVNLGYLQKVALPGDPRGYTTVDLGETSCFEDFTEFSRLAFHRSRPSPPTKHHARRMHQYSISNTVLQADLLINIPKMKTHKKSGVTLGMKSMIGLTNRKTWLPHYRVGPPPLGDEFDNPLSMMKWLHWRLSRFPLFGDNSLIVNIVLPSQQEFVMDGSWEGNDTLWRTILDLVRAVLYTDKKGTLKTTPQRKCLTIVDGIIAGEGDGPIRPEPKKAGVLIAGADLLSVEAACVHVMGLNPRSVKTISKAKSFFGDDLGCAEAQEIGWIPEYGRKIDMHFRPPSSWRGLTRTCEVAD